MGMVNIDKTPWGHYDFALDENKFLVLNLRRCQAPYS